MPIYLYKNPNTGEIFEEFRSIKSDLSFYKLQDGTLCERVYERDLNLAPTMINKNREVWEYDADYTRLTNPKYVKLNNGVKEKYDPHGKHWGGQGVGNNVTRKKDLIKKTGKQGQQIYFEGEWWSWNEEKKDWETP